MWYVNVCGYADITEFEVILKVGHSIWLFEVVCAMQGVANFSSIVKMIQKLQNCRYIDLKLIKKSSIEKC